MRWSVWILTALLASLGQVMAANPDPTYLAARGLGDGPDDCDPGFFEMTEKNLRESKSDEFYRDLISKTSKEHPEEYIRLGEVSFFARHAFNGLEVRCGSHKKGCTGIPTCTDILDYVKRHGGDKEKARKVYFSIKKIEFIIDAIFWFHRVSAIIEHHAGLVGELIVKDFGPKRKGIAEDSCKAIKGGLKVVSIITKSLETLVSSSEDGFSVGSVFSLAMKLVEEFGESGKDHVEALLLERAVNGTMNFPDLEYIKKPVDELCALEAERLSTINHKGNKGEDFASQSAVLKKQIIKVTSSIRETISRILDIVVNGDAIVHPDFNYLFELMSRHDWTDEARRLYESFDDKHVTRIFEKSLITIAWEDGKCYQKCVCEEGRPRSDLCDNRDANAKYRYCPEDATGCACQLQCMSSNVDGRRNEVQLLGIEQLPTWDIDFLEILVKSYKKYRNVKDVPVTGKPNDKDSLLEIDKPNGKDGLPEIDKLDGGLSVPNMDKALIKSIKAQEKLLELPTCASAQLDMGDLKKDGNHNRLFPCTCGDWRSNETQTFMQQLGLGKFQSGYKTKLAEELFTHDCPGSLNKAKLKPFNHFLALCELGVKWPHKGDVKASHGNIKFSQRHHVHMNTVDSRCLKLKGETAAMTEEDANFHFCTMSTTSKEVFADELGHINGAGLIRPGMPVFQASDAGNHLHMCKQFYNYR